MATQELNSLFKLASQFADAGELQASAQHYERCLKIAHDSAVFWVPDELATFVRSAALNLAQVLNRQGHFTQSLERIEEAMAKSPTPVGRAIALAAKGEALCGLGRIDEGTQAFDQAIQEQPIIGSLNSADSMTRVIATDLLGEAQRLVDGVLAKYANQLNSDLRAEASSINGKIAIRRGDKRRAHDCFAKALIDQPGYADAKLQMRLLESCTNAEGIPTSKGTVANITPESNSTTTGANCAHCGRTVSSDEVVVVDASLRVAGFDVLNNEDMDAFLATLRRLETRKFEPIQVCRNCEQSLKAVQAAHSTVLRSQGNLSACKARLLKCIAASKHAGIRPAGEFTVETMLQHLRLDHAESENAREYAISLEAAMQQADLGYADWRNKAGVAFGAGRSLPDLGVEKELAEAALFVERFLGRSWRRTSAKRSARSVDHFFNASCPKCGSERGVFPEDDPLQLECYSCSNIWSAPVPEGARAPAEPGSGATSDASSQPESQASATQLPKHTLGFLAGAKKLFRR